MQYGHGKCMVYILQMNTHACLTACGQVKLYGDTDLRQYWLGYWLMAWWYQAITWNQSSLIIKDVIWHSPGSNFIWLHFKNYNHISQAPIIYKQEN